MKVLIIICFTQVLVTYCITVPPFWPQQVARKTFKNHPPYTSTEYIQYRPSNIQQIYINHPESVEKQNKHNPQSYQIINFDNNNQDVSMKLIYKQPSSIQHLTEITQPVRNRTNYNTQENVNKNIENNEDKDEIREVPTRPIYPGEGHWAKYGTKYKLYIHPQNIKKPSEEDDDNPEGYDTFKTGEEKFLQAQNKFNHNLNNFPKSSTDDLNTESEPFYQKPEIGFIPEKLYTQVRKTESVKHLPRSAIDPEEENASRLREVVKDSRIHTVYTEEGYEDSAYDHVGHEKNAENHEGHAQTAGHKSGSSDKSQGRGQSGYLEDTGRRRGTNFVKKQLLNDDKSKYEDSERFKTRNKNFKNDAETSGTNQEFKQINLNSSSLPLPMNNIKKITIKNGDQGEINMEIHTEIKYTPQKKKHKYVKIIPSTKNLPDLNKTTEKPLKRFKRYDKDKLSKQYIRKRPTYYWKKIRTTTTEKSLIKNHPRQNFEAAFKTYNKSPKKPKIHPEINESIEITSKSPINKPLPTKITTGTTTKSTFVTITTNTTTQATTTIATTLKSPIVSNISSTTVHPDLLNPELTSKMVKPATPKILPVKIKKFKVKRQKRYTNNFPKINVDLDEFVDVSNLPNPTKQPDLTYIKYPYYNLPITENLPENSPLRYVEDMKNIPEKIEGELSFYESREHVIACPEIENNVNPIPERIENQTEGEETDQMADIPDLPRLKGLGDKIDCLKVKYFGENPLDSPFFKEETIAGPIPFFPINKQNGNISNTRKRELKIKILEPIVVLDEELMESATINPIHKNTEAVLKPPYTLIQMMTMNDEKIIRFKPKSIYDKISILEQTDKKLEKQKNDLPSTDKFIIIYDNQDVKMLNNSAAKNELKPEKNMTSANNESITQSTNQPQEVIQKHLIRKRPMNNIRKSKLTTTTTIEPPTVSVSKSIKPFKKPPNILPSRSPTNWQSANRQHAAFYNIFDISRFLPNVPNHRIVTSEVQYNEGIKPIQTINSNNKEFSSDTKFVAVQIPVLQDDITSKQVQMEENKSTETAPQSAEHVDMVPPITIDQDAASSEHIISKRDTLKSKKKSRKENVDDLMMEETENRPVYSVPLQRKPKVYTEIVRQKPARPQESEEEEDLNPRKRIYELKSNNPTSTTTTLYPEIVEEIATESSEPITTPEPKIYPVEANLQNPNIAQYIFFIEKLHEKWAKEDATSTTEITTTTQKVDNKTTAAQVVAESVNVERGEPAFLQIINQLHQLRKEEDNKTTPFPSTEAPTSEEYEAISIKHSNPFINLDSESFMTELKSMKAKLDPDSKAESTNLESSKSRNYSSRFKTNIDTSKYKTIERSPVTVRHNLSSRFKADDQKLPLQKEETTQLPMIIAIITRPQSTTESSKEKPSITDSALEETTNVPEPEEVKTTTIKTRQRGRFRPRQYTSTTLRPISSTTTNNATTLNSVYRRRRPTRITSTTTQPSVKPESYFARRRNRQRPTSVTQSNQEELIPLSAETTESVIIVTPVNNQKEETKEPKKQRRFQKVQERRVMSEVTLTRFFEPTSDEEDSEESRKHQYEVIGPLSNVETGHGGNYKHENEQLTIKDPTIPSGSFYTDPNLAVNINHLKDTKETSTEKTQASNSLLTQEEIAEKMVQKPTNSKVNLYPNMARMINRLAEMKPEDVNEDVDGAETQEEVQHKPTFIKDPSQRMYYYAKL